MFHKFSFWLSSGKDNYFIEDLFFFCYIFCEYDEVMLYIKIVFFLPFLGTSCIVADVCLQKSVNTWAVVYTSFVTFSGLRFNFRHCQPKLTHFLHHVFFLNEHRSSMYYTHIFKDATKYFLLFNTSSLTVT